MCVCWRVSVSRDIDNTVGEPDNLTASIVTLPTQSPGWTDAKVPVRQSAKPCCSRPPFSLPPFFSPLLPLTHLLLPFPPHAFPPCSFCCSSSFLTSRLPPPLPSPPPPGVRSCNTSPVSKVWCVGDIFFFFSLKRFQSSPPSSSIFIHLCRERERDRTVGRDRCDNTAGVDFELKPG